jgi:hypothetical protein
MATRPLTLMALPRETILAGRTAIRRASGAYAKPIGLLLEKRLVKGTVLHHGCGKDLAGSEALRQAATSVTDYDPIYAPNERALEHRYDTIVSNYVLNVLPPRERKVAICEIAHCTYGTAFISVRGPGDTWIVGKPEEDGFRAQRGTFQRSFTFEQMEEELSSSFGEIRLVAGSARSVTLTIAALRPL